MDYQREREIERLARTLSLAEVRCLSWDEIRPRLRRLWDDPQADELVIRVEEIGLSASESVELANAIVQLSSEAVAYDRRTRPRLDRRLMRLAGKLPRDLRYEQALTDLRHPRKLRRLGACKALREIGVDEQLAPKLVRCYQETADQALLQLIARSPAAVGAVDARWLVTSLDESYWRMRTIEALVLRGAGDVEEYSCSHPREFVHAVGRARGLSHKSALRSLLREHSRDLDFVALVAWALGRLEDREGLTALRTVLHSATV